MQDHVTRKCQAQFRLFFLPQDKLKALSEWCGTNDTKQDNMNILHAPIAEKYQRKAGEQ